MMSNILLIVLAYLAGSVSAAIITCRILGLPDPRGQGSGNPGATNVLRFGGRTAAGATLTGDVAKGVIPVLLAHAFGSGPAIPALAALAAVLGHLYPVYFGFRGGKGVATAFGAILALAWQVALAALAVWLVVAAVGRISSLAALSASVVAPFIGWWLGLPAVQVAVMAIISALLLWRHRTNIGKLLAGTESRIGQRGA